jgi:hypothetical protein
MNVFRCFKMELETVGKDRKSDYELEGKSEEWFPCEKGFG